MALTAASFLNGKTTQTQSNGRGAASFLNYTPTLREQIEEQGEQNNGGLLGGIGYTLGKLGTGAFGILEGIWDYTAGGIAKLFGADEWAEEQFANNITGNWNQSLDEWYNPSQGWKVAGDVAGGIGNSLVGIAAVAGAAALTALSGGTLAPAAAGVISSAVIGLGAAGMATTEAYERTGELGGKEFGYGFLSGVTEAGLEYVSGAAGKISAKLFAKQTAKTVAQKSIIKGMISNFAGEAFEEAASEFLEPYYLRWTQVDPNAENATAKQIGYAALIGGISGALMGGIGDVYSSARSIRRGSQIAQNPSHVASIVDMSRNFADYEAQHSTGLEAYQYVSDLVSQWDALGGGDVDKLTVKQKKILGQMESAAVVLANAESVQRSKAQIIANAEAFVKAVNERQVIDAATGKPFHFNSVEELTGNEGLLTQFAVADALGKLMLSHDSVYDLVSNKRTDGIMQADFRNFQKEASPEQKRSVNELFGIDVDSITYEDFVDKIQSTNRSVFEGKRAELQILAQSQKAVSNAVNTRAEVETIEERTNIADGTTVYNTETGKKIAITKSGNTYYVYQDGNISKKLTRAELREIIAALNGKKPKKQAPTTTKKVDAKKKSASPKSDGGKRTDAPKKTSSETETRGKKSVSEETAAEKKAEGEKKAPEAKETNSREESAPAETKKPLSAEEKAAEIEKMRHSEASTERVLGELCALGTLEYEDIISDDGKLSPIADFATDKVKDYVIEDVYSAESLAKAISEYADEIKAGNGAAVTVKVMDRALEIEGKPMPDWYKEQYHPTKTETEAKKAPPAKTTTDRKPSAAKAREELVKLTTRKDVQENVHGYFVTDGKQYISDGHFVARFNDVIESLQKADGDMPKILKMEFDEFATTKPTRRVDIDMSALREASKGKLTQGVYALVRLGDTNYQVKYVRRVLEAITNPKVYVTEAAENSTTGGMNPLYITGDNGEAIILPVRSVGGVQSDFVYEADFSELSKEENKALRDKAEADRKKAERERKKRFEEQERRERAEQEQRDKERTERLAAEKKEHEAKISKAEETIASGKKITNDTVRVYQGASDITGKETSLFIALFDKYGIKIPAKTRGFIANYLTGIERTSDGWNYWHKKGHDANTASYFNALIDAIEHKSEGVNGAPAPSAAPTTINGKGYSDFTAQEFEKLPKVAQDYLRRKHFNPNAIILNEAGDFYESFFDDATVASELLDLTLTSRNIGLSERAKMTGFPIPFLSEYRKKLQSKGYDVIVVDSRGEATVYEAAKDAQEAKAVTEPATSTTAETTQETTQKTRKSAKTEDFGEKIGGARKDEWKSRGLIVTDIETMNAREIARHVRKENVWKRPNWVEAVNNGGNRGLLYAQNEIYLSLNATPFMGYGKVTEEAAKAAAQTYVQEVSEIQKMAAAAKTKEDFAQMGAAWLAKNGYVEEAGGRLRYTQKFYNSPALASSDYASTINNIVRKFDTMETIAQRKGFGVAAEERLPKGYEIHTASDASSGTGKYYIVRGSWIVARGFSSYEEALAKGKELFGTAADKKTQTGKQRYVPEQLKDVHRTGLDYRAGKDATGEDFLRDFGIKGGEFGNWLSENDRKESLNYGYDAFCDLADALDIELTDISLNGTLSIGFGSRGQGLSGAVAHYEPARKVINLTKMKGAGSLAHEWWHAFEDYASGDTHQASMESDFRQMPQKTREAAINLVNAIRYRDATVEEKNLVRQHNYEMATRYLDSVLDQEFNLFGDKLTAEEKQKRVKVYGYKRVPTDAEIEQFASLRERAASGDSTVIDELSNLRKEVYGRVIPKETRDTIFGAIARIKTATDSAVEIRLHKNTKFYDDAIALGKALSKDGGYWESTSEMLARSFAAYIGDKTGRGNDYLTGHAYGGVTLNNGKTVYICPMGEERVKINAAFDALFAAAKEDGLISSATRKKPTTTAQYALSESADLNSQPAGNKSQRLAPLQMKRAESYAQRNVNGYENLTQAEKLEVEWTIASGWRNGVDEATILDLAKISAQTGIGIGFADFQATAADGSKYSPDAACYTRSGHLTIYLNANGKRSIEAATLHELTHYLEGTDGYEELRREAVAYYDKHPDEKATIESTYRSLYGSEEVKFADEILPSELTAHYIETMLEKRNVLTKITAEKPRFIKRCINWLKNRVNSLRGISAESNGEFDLLIKKFTSVYNLRRTSFANKQSATQYVIKPFNRADNDLEANIRSVSELGAVATLTGDEFKVGGESLISEVSDYYATIGNNAYNDVLGDVELTRRGIKGSLAHGIGQNKAAAYKAVPQIISDGEIVDFQERWKGRNYDTAIIAAPITIAGDEYYAAVVVRRTEATQRFYLHEIDIEKRQAVQPESASETRTQELGGSPSINSIFQKIRNVKRSGKSYALDMSNRQGKTSAATSINSSKLPAVFSRVQFKRGTVNLDIGGGKFDNATEFLATQGVKNYIYDPYNRSEAHNRAAARATENGQSDTVTISNVLNVIDTLEGRQQVLANAVDALKPDGTAYITVYEGNGSGEARTTGADQFQLNRKLRDYLPEVRQFFGNVTVKNGVIIARSPIKGAEIKYALPPTKGGDRVMTELPNDTVTIKDVITRKKTLSQLTAQFKGNKSQFTEGFQIAMTNAQAGLERVMREAGIDDAPSRTNYVRAGRYAAFNALDPSGGQYSLDGETRLGDSWGKIWKPIYTLNKSDGVAYARFQEYLLHWHNIDRLAVGKPVFGDDVTVADSRAAIAEIEAQYPQFKGIAEKVWKFLDNNLQLSVDSGMYSQEYADRLRSMYPHYVPTMREEHQSGVSPIQGKNNIRVNNAKKAAKGGDTKILPIDDVVAQQTIQRYTSARTNSLLVDLLNGADHDEFRIVSSEDAAIDIDTDTLVTTYEDKAKNTHQITFYHDGNRITAQVSRNLFKGVEAFAPSGDSAFNNAILNGAAKINSTFKRLVTSWNPFFSFFRNPIRDIQEAGLYTRYPLRTFAKNYARARREISTNGRYWQEAKAAGITSASVYDYEKGLTYKNESAIKKLGQRLESASNAVEMAPRLAEYISAREAGLSVQEALLQAQDVTTNFGRSGVFAKKLNATIMPFLNPAIQGFSKMVRAYTGKDAAQSWVNLIVRSIMLGLAASALNDLLNDDDEDYKNLSDYVKENNYVIALGDGDFIKIPKGRVASVIGGAYLRAKWYMEGDEDAFEGWISNIASQVTPVDNFSRTIFSPLTDISTNTTWYGGQIESEKWSDTQPKDRYDETTSSIAIWLGKVFNYSPVKIDYLLDQYGGVVTDIVLPATTLQAEKGIVSQNLIANATTNSRWGTEFYSQIEKYTYKKTAGDAAAKGVVKYLNGIKSTLSDMYAQKREIQSDKTLSDSEKNTQSKIVQAAINALQKDSLTNAKYLYEELKKYDLSEENFDNSYLDAVSVVVGEEFALRTYNKQVYEKAKSLEKLGIGFGTYYDYYFALKQISAATDASGRTISGSKKAQVIAFTWAQDIPRIQKLILIMSAGYKISDGDIRGLSAKQAQRVVAQYITRLNITKEEKAALAELCGLTVSNGRIIITA